jgi:parallel beta-helix repeat protein
MKGINHDSRLFAAIYRKAKLSVTVLSAISIILLWASPAKAGTTITQSTCPVMIAQSGEYDLATDVGPCLPGVDGIDIVASAVTLHLDGHSIIGSLDPTICNNSYGMRVGLPAPTPMLSQVHILGEGTVSNFRHGLHAENSAGSFVKFVTVTAACMNEPFATFGFLILAPGGQWKLQGNVVREPGATSSGIAFFGVDDNDIVRNDVNDTMEFSNSNNNTIVNNTANDNFAGISIGPFGPSSNNELHANTANNNALNSGISVFVGSVANNITGNTAFNNHPWDLEDDNPNCDSNKWVGNHFGTASQTCIQ